MQKVSLENILRCPVSQKRAAAALRGANRLALFLCAFLLASPVLRAQRTQLKAPWNTFSTDTDIKEGKLLALQAQKQYVMCNEPKIDAYLTQLGLRLAAKLPTRGVQYPWEFHCVNDKSINAFALPGGYVFVNRGAIEAADNESQLAGVMAHELSHVALRHGTSQASKAQLAQGAVGILGGLFGNSTSGTLLTQGVLLGAGSVLLRYSRSAETQADVMGTQVLFDTGYDPRAMAQFFEKLQAETAGKNPPQFFSDHPNPDNRLERVDEEIEKLGGDPTKGKRDSAEFEATKRLVMALPVVKKPVVSTTAGTAAPVAGSVPPPVAASTHSAAYEANSYALNYPDNWKKYPDPNDEGISFAPENGVLQDSKGNGALAYGMIVGVTKPNGDSSASDALDTATQQLIGTLQQANPAMKITRKASHVRLNGEPGLSTYLSNDSPAGGQETDWLITVLRPGGLYYFICVAPQNVYTDYDSTFAAILDSVRFQK